MPIGRERLANEVRISDETLEFLTPLLERVTWAAKRALAAMACLSPAGQEPGLIGHHHTVRDHFGRACLAA